MKIMIKDDPSEGQMKSVINDSEASQKNSTLPEYRNP